MVQYVAVLILRCAVVLSERVVVRAGAQATVGEVSLLVDVETMLALLGILRIQGSSFA